MKDYLRTELKEDAAVSSTGKSRTHIVFRRFGKAVAVAAITITLLFSTAMVIAEVVQNNSAAAQETSATSEELTAQATTLSGMVSVFKLRQ